MTEILAQYGIAGVVLVGAFLLGRMAITKIGVPLMHAHMETLRTWQEETKKISTDNGSMATVLSSMQGTQVEIHTAVARFSASLEHHVAKRQEYDARILEALERLVDRIEVSKS